MFHPAASVTPSLNQQKHVHFRRLAGIAEVTQPMIYRFAFLVGPILSFSPRSRTNVRGVFRVRRHWKHRINWVRNGAVVRLSVGSSFNPNVCFRLANRYILSYMCPSLSIYHDMFSRARALQIVPGHLSFKLYHSRNSLSRNLCYTQMRLLSNKIDMITGIVQSIYTSPWWIANRFLS